jgi:hypothetical protein
MPELTQTRAIRARRLNAGLGVLAAFVWHTAALAQAGAAPPVDPVPPSAEAAPAESPEAPAGATEPAASAHASEAPVITPPSAVSPADAKSEAAADAVASELTQAAVSEAGDDDVKLNVYGFADFGFSATLRGEFLSPYSSFAIGNFNLYLDSRLGDRWRSLGEVRFMYLPHGSTPGAGFNPSLERTDTTVGDYSDVNRTLRWGGIHIERIWIEYSAHELLTVRAGQWLTPYGIWNVDHGSPVILGVRRPYVVGHGMFPESQTGIETYGSLYVDATRFGYHLTLSNGRGPIDTHQDLNADKALGARLFVNNPSPLGDVTLGVSGYRGTYTDRQDSVSVTPGGVVEIDHQKTLEYDEQSLAADLKWETKDVLFQSEFVLHDVAFDDETRPADPAAFGGPPGFQPDSREWGVYGLVGYRAPLWNLTPFVQVEYFAIGNSNPNIPYPDALAMSGGLNVRPTPRVVLKAQLTHAMYPTTPPILAQPDSTDILETQVAWSF